MGLAPETTRRRPVHDTAREQPSVLPEMGATARNLLPGPEAHRSPPIGRQGSIPSLELPVMWRLWTTGLSDGWPPSAKRRAYPPPSDGTDGSRGARPFSCAKRAGPRTRVAGRPRTYGGFGTDFTRNDGSCRCCRTWRGSRETSSSPTSGYLVGDPPNGCVGSPRKRSGCSSRSRAKIDSCGS